VIEGVITFEMVLFMIAMGGPLVGAWWFLFSYILAVRRDLNDFRLEVAKSYASQELLKDLEARLVTELKDMKKEFHDMPERFAAVLVAASKDK